MGKPEHDRMAAEIRSLRRTRALRDEEISCLGSELDKAREDLRAMRAAADAIALMHNRCIEGMEAAMGSLMEMQKIDPREELRAAGLEGEDIPF